MKNHLAVGGIALAGACALAIMAETVSARTLVIQGGTLIEGNGGPPLPVEAPQPAIETITPLMATAGDPTTTVTLTGFNYVCESRGA